MKYEQPRYQNLMHQTLADAVLNYLISVITNINVVLPSFIVVIIIWRVARLRGFTWDNFQHKVDESVADTLKEQISEVLLNPLFEQHGIQLPRGREAWGYLAQLVFNDPNNVHLLTSIYQSIQNFGAESPYFLQILALVFGG